MSTSGEMLSCAMDILEPRFLLAAGALDTSFGKAGKLTLYGWDGNAGTNVVVQRDGKLLAAAGHRPKFQYQTITRYTTDGKWDPTFGTGGRIILPDPKEGTAPLAMQSDGKILSARLSSKGTWSLVRYNSGGKAESGFAKRASGLAAAARFTSFVQFYDRIYAIRYVSGFQIERYLLDGRPDAAYGARGVVQTSFGAGGSYCESVVVQRDGKAVVAGNANGHFAMARYNADGSLDPAFGTGGILISDLFSESEAITRIFIQRDGKIVATGRNLGSHGYTFALARYLRDGSLDTAFGDNGSVLTDVSAFRPSVLQSDGKIVLVGASGSNEIAIARYKADGVLDSAFGSGGIARVRLGGRVDPRHVYTVGKDNRVMAVTRVVTPKRGFLVVTRNLGV